MAALNNVVYCTVDQFRRLKAGETINNHTYNSSYIYICEPEDAPISNYLPLAGGTMTGDIILSNEVSLKAKDSTNDTSYSILYANSDDNIIFGNDNFGSINSYNSICPITNNAYNLGGSSNQWNNIYGKILYENGTSLSNKYLALSGGTMAGTIKFNSSSLPSKTLSYICGVDAFANGGEMGWQSKADFLNGYATQSYVANVAAGLVKAYVVGPLSSSSNSYINSHKTDNTIYLKSGGTANASTITLLDNTSLDITTLKTGDVIYFTDTDIPDRWVSVTNTGNDIALFKLETTKVDLSVYLAKSGGTMTGSLTLNNGIALQAKNSSGTALNLLYVNTNNTIKFGNTSLDAISVMNKITPNTTDTYNLGESTLQWNNIYGKTIYENGTSLASKYVSNAGLISTFNKTEEGSQYEGWYKLATVTYTAWKYVNLVFLVQRSYSARASAICNLLTYADSTNGIASSYFNVMSASQWEQIKEQICYVKTYDSNNKVIQIDIYAYKGIYDKLSMSIISLKSASDAITFYSTGDPQTITPTGYFDITNSCFLPLTGGTLFDETTGAPLTIKAGPSKTPEITFKNSSGTTVGSIGVTSNSAPYFNNTIENLTLATTNYVDNAIAATIPTITIAASQIASTTPLLINPTDAQKTILENLNNAIIKIDLSAIYTSIGLDSPYGWIVRNATKNAGNTTNGAVIYEYVIRSNDIDLTTASMAKLGDIGIYYFYDAVGTFATYKKKMILTVGKVNLTTISHATNLENGTANSSLIQKKYGTTFTTNNPNATGYTSEQTVAAAGNFSAVFGGAGRAIGAFTFVEGENNIAVGNDAHAEGYSTFALGAQSHAEGLQASAKGTASHAEGVQTIAQGDYSHAEGYITKAEGQYSHASGSNTIAKTEAQTVIGKYNVEDTNGTYAFIVGNGSSSARSNAFTVTWGGTVNAPTIKENGTLLSAKYVSKPTTTIVYSTVTDVMSSTVNGSKTTTVTLTSSVQSGDKLKVYFYNSSSTYHYINSTCIELEVFLDGPSTVAAHGYEKLNDGGCTVEIYLTLTGTNTLQIKTIKTDEMSSAPAGTRAMNLLQILKVR